MRATAVRAWALGAGLGLLLGLSACDVAFPGSSGVDPINEPDRDEPAQPQDGEGGQTPPSGSGGAPTDAGSSGAGGGNDGEGGQKGEAGHGGASGGGGMAGASASSGGFPPLPADPCGYPASRTVNVSNARALSEALASATPGTRIALAEGTYDAKLVIDRSGRAGSPIVLCGPRSAILRTTRTNDVIRIQADHVVLSGFQLRGGLRGVITDGSEGVLLSALEVHDIGQEALHLRSGSRNNLIRNCRIYNTGVTRPEFGEGIYVGSAESSWSKYGGGSNQPDRSDQNFILENHIGPDVRAEHIDIKEGTTGGTIQKNVFDGRGMSGEGYADSWIDVKGNGWVILENEGKVALEDGFQVHVVKDGWGRGNTFRANVFDLQRSGYGVWIEAAAQANKVSCDNRMIGAAKGLANVACQ